jgi:hypothetical protein
MARRNCYINICWLSLDEIALLIEGGSADKTGDGEGGKKSGGKQKKAEGNKKKVIL